MEKARFPKLARNLTSAFGATVALITAFIGLVMLIVSLTTEQTSAYFGVFLYVVLPAILILGLVLIPIGMFREWRRWKTTGEKPIPKFPIVDLNNRRHRNATIVFVAGTTLFITLTSVGSYQAYHYSESVAFCGTTCHTVMEPEYTAYQQSPHARVACAECHVGSGAGWYAKSKLSGAYQVYSVFAKAYAQPIATPIKNLRPARGTCEECHWPEKTYGNQERQFTHYMYDSTNTPWTVTMLINTDTGEPHQSQRAGIHWHINKDIMIEYIARDDRRQDIPWVKVTEKKTGKVTIYQDTEKPLTADEIAKGSVRKMDCIDCHNRPSHVYHSPDYAIDKAIQGGMISQTLPDIKRVAVEAMAKEYSTKDSAMAMIASAISDHYGADGAAADKQIVQQAVAGTQKAFSDNIFPYMKVRWTAYPNNIGHFNDKGCMRCHLGNHKAEDGSVVTHKCNACHQIQAEGLNGHIVRDTTGNGLDFQHPVDIDNAWQETGCFECHSGVQP